MLSHEQCHSDITSVSSTSSSSSAVASPSVQTPPKKQLHVVCAIIERGNEILTAQRMQGEFAGMWEFPGGKVEDGESLHDALRREIREELEANIEIGDCLMTLHHEYPSFFLVMDCFLCTLPQGEVLTLHDHAAVKWVRRESLRDVNWIEADIQIIDRLLG